MANETTSATANTETPREYAIVRSGGKQYVMEPGKKVLVDLMEAEVGAEVELADVLYVSAMNGKSAVVGTPAVEGAVVKAKVLGHEKGKKVIVFKMVNRTGYKKKRGHRQQYTRLLVEGISA